ncbi:MAG: cyclic nucleotide-binding domain-containing protein [Myxococcota bacterium]
MPIEPQILLELPLFAGLTTTEIEEIATQMSAASYAPRAAIMREGDAPGHPIYVLVKGSVDVVKRGFDGRARVLTSLAAPSVFGEVELLARRPAIASVVAMSTVEVATLGRGVFDELVTAGRPCVMKVVRNLAQVLSYRLAATDERLAALGNFLAPQDLEKLDQVQHALFGDWGSGGSPPAATT